MTEREKRHEHSFPNGTVSVKMHKRKRLTLVVDRDELHEGVAERLEALEHENRTLRRVISEMNKCCRMWDSAPCVHEQARMHLEQGDG